ncbi:hypothetical protein Fleli_0553 [Bernardetia litoralis DSM 6794]|uniref:Uncharacterized protein n=1 Tax=Bernardetia litoralis (strain ATCC 23117 / DSM 6794 / NBRC 15988 / NCIMB 1366 / Fx l1 / Sio-4) TaxID=880071 RepID=I4AGD5_BERLS|nr:hypothetical protein [Bernardetia litoralis]AFM03020.1 hypothetical protein Fleli_0553 [Bernardetia litoralis DSM 6794]
MKYLNSIKTDTYVSKFAYIFLAFFAFTALACESNNDDNPLVTSTIEGYISDTNYWFSSGPSVISSGEDSLGKDTILNISGTSYIDGSVISMFIPYPDVGSFSVAPLDSADTTGNLVPAIFYDGESIPSGTINITRFDTVRYILEAEFNFSFEGMVESDSGTVDTTSIEFTKGKIKAAYLRK